MERLFGYKIYRALQSQIEDTVQDIYNYGLTGATNRADDTVVNEKIAQVITDMYDAAGKSNANYIYRLVQRQLPKTKQIHKRFSQNDKWVSIIEAYLNQFLLNKVVLPITDTTKKQILTILNRGFSEGWGVDEIVRALRTSEITRNRARLIVRTESARATNFAGMMGAWENEYETVKFWIEVKDNRTRRSHRHATGVGGEHHDLLDRYSNGLMFPGDPAGSASEVVNCRCAQGYKPKRDSRGRLIPKEDNRNIIEAMSSFEINRLVGNIAAELLNI